MEYNYNDILIHANKFYNIYLEIAKNNEDKDEYSSYAVEFVNGTFTCELYLKALCLKLNKKHAHGHDLKDLFMCLPDDYKTLIGQKMHKEDYAYPIYPNKDCVLDTLWYEFSKGFIEYRYEYEKVGNGKRLIIFPNLLSEFATILKEVTESIYL
ncbi:MAG: hypothetical protein E7249_01865 [Paenibacillaceae bacterium]|nr:hypothetical protein [Paenibacillaceae bacterium]